MPFAGSAGPGMVNALLTPVALTFPAGVFTMPRSVPILALLGCLSATPALPGAWPKEQGHGFVSADIRLSRPRTNLLYGEVSDYRTIYFEYGVTDRLTMGLDLGRSVSGEEKAVVFARYPIPLGSDRFRFAAELGLGRIDEARVLRPGLSFGTSFEAWPDAWAWIAVDAIAEHSLDAGSTDYKIDATFGVTFPNRWKGFVQLQTGAPHDEEPFLRIAPSVVMPVGKRSHVELGATWGVSGDDQLGIKLGIWHAF